MAQLTRAQSAALEAAFRRDDVAQAMEALNRAQREQGVDAWSDLEAPGWPSPSLLWSAAQPCAIKCIADLVRGLYTPQSWASLDIDGQREEELRFVLAIAELHHRFVDAGLGDARVEPALVMCFAAFFAKDGDNAVAAVNALRSSLPTYLQEAAKQGAQRAFAAFEQAALDAMSSEALRKSLPRRV